MPRKKRRKPSDEAIDSELIAKGRGALRDFDESQAIHVPAKKRENKLISIRLPVTMIKELRDLAIKKGDIGYQQLIKIFISEGLLRSQFETSSLSAMWTPRFRMGDWSHLDSSFSIYHELQTPLSRTGDLRWT